MKKLILAIIAMMGMTASAATLTGKIVLKGANTGSAAAQVCMNGSCADVGNDGTYSLDVSTDGIASRHSGVGASTDLYRLGQFVVSASGRQVELINMKGQRITSDKGSLDISKVPKGVYMATDGKHVLRLNTMSKSGYAVSGGSGTMASGVAARATDTTQLYGIAYVVVNGDTLKEIPVTSWNLPTGYMVQRSHSVCVPSKFAADTAQVVYWTNDSIAYVVNFGKNSIIKGTTQRSTFIYCMYDSAAYANGNSAYQYFYRVRKDTILAYTDIGVAETGSGNAELADSSDFHLTTYNRTGYSYVPALDTIKKWADSAKLNYNIGVGNWVSLEDLGAKADEQHKDSTDYTMDYLVPQSDTAKFRVMMRAADSIKITYSTGYRGNLNVYAYAYMSTYKSPAGETLISMWYTPSIKTENPDSGNTVSDTVLVGFPGATAGTPSTDIRKSYVGAEDIMSAYFGADSVGNLKMTNVKMYIHIKN